MIVFAVMRMYSTLYIAWKTLLTYSLGIGCSLVTHGWNKYQHGIVQSLGRHMYGIKKLVAALGPMALEDYCNNGCLDEDLVRRFEATEAFGP